MSSSVKNFAKIYEELSRQRTGLPPLPQPFTRVEMTRMSACLDPILVRNCDPEKFENDATFGALFPLLTDPDEWEISGTVWLYLHQLTFFTIRSGQRASLFLRYAEMRHRRLFANASSAGFPGLPGGDFDMSQLTTLAQNFGGGDFVDRLRAIFDDVDASDETMIRAKIHDVFVLMKDNPMMAMIPITEEKLYDVFVKMMPVVDSAMAESAVPMEID